MTKKIPKTERRCRALEYVRWRRAKKRFEKACGCTMKADLSHPLDIMRWKGRWVLLDGLHRLLKAKILGQKIVNVRKIPPSIRLFFAK